MQSKISSSRDALKASKLALDKKYKPKPNVQSGYGFR